MSDEEEEKLGQDDIDELLDQDEEEEDGSPDSSDTCFEEYDFLNPSRFNRSERETIQRISGNLAQRSSQPLSRLLNTKVQVQLASCEQTMWQYITEQLSDSTVGYSFKLNSLGYSGIMTVGSNFCCACLESLTGGDLVAEEASEITEMDARVFSHVVENILDPLPELWSELGDFTVEPGEFMSDMESAVPFSPDEDIFQICLFAEGEFGTGELSISVPFEVVRDLPKLINKKSSKTEEERKEIKHKIRKKLGNVPIEISVELGRAYLPAKKILRLKPGDAVVLNTAKDKPLEICVNQEPKLHGRPVLLRKNLAVKVEGDLNHGN